MYIESLALQNFRCFGHQRTVINLDPGLTPFIGLNGTGKTAACQALRRLFGISADDRTVRVDDFHVPAAELETPRSRALVIEAVLAFPELDDEDDSDATGAVPEFFHRMAADDHGILKCRIVLEAAWEDDGTLDGGGARRRRAGRARRPRPGAGRPRRNAARHPRPAAAPGTRCRGRGRAGRRDRAAGRRRGAGHRVGGLHRPGRQGHGTPGTCRASFLDCFHCGNCLITTTHLPRLLALARDLEQRREQVNAAEWWRRYGPAWAAIRHHVLPEFTPAEVQAAEAVMPADSLLDLAEGIRERP